MQLRRLLFAVSALALLSAAPAAAQPVNAVDRLAWLAGCWEQRAPNRVVMEMWMPPMGGTMLGSSQIGRAHRLNSSHSS